jgi:ElaB/YqjD/DUF883 family membrane-anchored ribosome-binding protein
MELYYKDLISEEGSLDKMVDDLMLLVQGAEEVTGAGGLPKEEITTRLARLKAGCRRATEHAMAGAQTTDKLFRRYPYSAVGVAFALGVLVGVALKRRS